MNATLLYSKPELKNALVCPLCGSSRDLWDFSAEMFGAGPYDTNLFSIYKCRLCGIGITDPVPSEDESHLLYEDRSSFDFQGDDSSIAAALKRMATDRDVRTLVGGAHLRQPVSRMLDYACGNGAFARSMQKIFPKSAVWATDYHSEAPPMIRGGNVNYVPYGNVAANGPFDFILCRHVLEHTYDPQKFLRGMHDLLSPGGVLMLEVPNLQAPLRNVFGKYWGGYYVPYHPIHFSDAALRRAVAGAGLVLENAGTCEMPQVGRSLRNVLRCKYNAVLFALGVLLHPMQFGARCFTGQATCLRLWARKV